ncbi:MAG: type II secretion system protein M [Desulfobacula sp.]|uniref:GspMb/PilO family protein n=1 Tax=Desulfobacula sp. TaxID=2593537 RepID=UPI0025B88872|nr:GspMb/PilO family protein [Desulfobacula sp.]MCD4719994.1 type II secretion system protein M [Desulfobacula sp.]
MNLKIKDKTILTRERIIIIVVGILILVIGAIYRFSPGIHFFSASSRVKLITKYQNRSVNLPGLEERHIFLTGHAQKLSNHLIFAQSKELAGVAVQNMLRDMASRENISFKSIKALKADVKSYQFVSIVPVKLVFKAKIRQLENLLYRIEIFSKLLSVSELRIIKPSTGKEDDLNIVMIVQGFLDKKSYSREE